MFSGNYTNSPLPVWQQGQQVPPGYQSTQHHRVELGSVNSVYSNQGPLSSQPSLPVPTIRYTHPNLPHASHTFSNNASVGTLGYTQSVRVEIDSSGTVGYADHSFDHPSSSKESPGPAPSPQQHYQFPQQQYHPTRQHRDVISPEGSRELAELSALPTPISGSTASSNMSASMFSHQHSIPDNMMYGGAGNSSASLHHIPYNTMPPYSSTGLLIHAVPTQPLLAPAPICTSTGYYQPQYLFSGAAATAYPQDPSYQSSVLNAYNMARLAHNPYSAQGTPIHLSTPSSNPNNSGNRKQAPPSVQGSRRAQPSALDHPEHSPNPPCKHNNWDNLRVKKSIMMLACRDCGAKWRRVFPPKDMCEPFHGPSQHCSAGKDCPLLHVHRYKNRNRAQEDGEDSQSDHAHRPGRRRSGSEPNEEPADGKGVFPLKQSLRLETAPQLGSADFVTSPLTPLSKNLDNDDDDITDVLADAILSAKRDDPHVNHNANKNIF